LADGHGADARVRAGRWGRSLRRHERRRFARTQGAPDAGPL